jgi:hypothetical protein
MRHMLLLYLRERPGIETPEGATVFESVRKFNRELAEREVLVSSAPLDDPDKATSVRVRDDRTLTSDGPYAETKEWLAGYFIVECEREQAVELAKRCPTARTGTVEVRALLRGG